ncbi:unnamed protein product, partial [marine sediment metagenome]
MVKTIAGVFALSMVLGAVAATGAKAGDEMSAADKEAAIPENPLKDAYFGEQHVHTSYSLDAFIGGEALTPDNAYRFAKGGAVTVYGKPHSIGRPLDFVAITDHAEYLGEMYTAQVEGAPGYDNPKLVELRSLDDFEDQEAWFLKYVVSNNRSGAPQHTDFYPGDDALRSGWKIMVDAVERHYVPGTFTTIPAFEWSAAPKGANMHRNVFFRDTKVPSLPISAVDTSDEEELWEWLAEQEQADSTL